MQRTDQLQVCQVVVCQVVVIIARSAAAAKRQLSPDRPGEIPDLALPRFLTGEIYF